MAHITIPNQDFAAMTWRRIEPAQVNISQWTGARQVLPSGRAWWECTVTLPPLVGYAAAEDWIDFIEAMNGSANTCTIESDFAPSGVTMYLTDYPDINIGLAKVYEISMSFREAF